MLLKSTNQPTKNKQNGGQIKLSTDDVQTTFNANTGDAIKIFDAGVEGYVGGAWETSSYFFWPYLSPVNWHLNKDGFFIYSICILVYIKSFCFFSINKKLLNLYLSIFKVVFFVFFIAIDVHSYSCSCTSRST